ncbi:MAG: undecaprenyl-diphosphate phosphatase [Rickettsiales bacterium]|nr:undecaprenyl-diphosphate phosphatase [Rickettsiales bacterium]
MALALVNIVVEFLPISSTAHVILLNRFLASGTSLKLPLAISQLAVDLVLCLHFRKIIGRTIRNFFSDRKTRLFCYNIILTSLPFLIVGALFGRTVRKYFYSSSTIAIFLILGGVFLIFAENHPNEKRTTAKGMDSLEEIEPSTMYRIGLAQMFSIVPGVSRSACTIGSALLSGLPRETAVDFSFFISIPVGIAGSMFDILGEVTLGISNYRLPVCYFIVSTIVPLFFAKRMLEFLKSHRLSIFGYYRILLGTVSLLIP